MFSRHPAGWNLTIISKVEPNDKGEKVLSYTFLNQRGTMTVPAETEVKEGDLLVTVEGTSRGFLVPSVELKVIPLIEGQAG